MTPKPRTAKTIALIATVAGSVLALALAGPAIAHHHHHDSDDPAGTIASFDPDSGVLAIDLSSGGTVSGEVTRLTWIQCGDEWHHGWRHGRHHGRRQLHHFEDGDHDWGHSDCSSDDLTAGAVVDEAILGLHDGQAFFWKVELDD
jgi:hypothetical protein